MPNSEVRWMNSRRGIPSSSAALPLETRLRRYNSNTIISRAVCPIGWPRVARKPLRSSPRSRMVESITDAPSSWYRSLPGAENTSVERRSMKLGNQETPCQGQLSGFAAPGGCLCAGGHHGYRPDQRSPRRGFRRPSASFCAISGPAMKRSPPPCAPPSTAASFEHEYAHVFDGDKNWQSLAIPTGGIYQWDDASTYIKKPPYFDNMADPNAPIQDFHQMRVLALLGDSVTTDHISPAGSIPKDGPAGKYLMAQG